MSVARLAALAACATGALLATATQAQQVHRIVGPDGKVTFSDRAPEDKKAQSTVLSTASGGAASNPALPTELRQIASRFPVTLYTGESCSPCQQARQLLVQRGVPFTERSVNTNDDLDALRRLSGESALPFGTIGRQQLKGFSDAEWTQYLDAAGYPAQSRLPRGYTQPAATPLAPTKAPAASAPDAPQEAASAPTGRPRRQAPPPPPPGAPTPSNPAGIRF
ncbi:MAG TPA: glutaredoxin family protein [Giesbergeria sp.]|nr:glutaredoxin family protein [Giesbergeria sp.]HNI76366.1 glutaredoxin family protein [Giesbergeria sp.]HNK07051.1 glutaredoxin family protein [Giesbergeria sp.]HNN16741.1 glutaredoxin family protein [Giesbergeria sp.]